MSALHRKLLRDLLRLWPQVVAIALVMAAGATTLILGVGTHGSLADTRAAYYEENRFADVFADVTRAPLALADEIAHIPGVAAVEPRIAKSALLDLPGLAEPASAMLISLPDRREQRLDLLTMVAGRKPAADDEREVVVSEAFANANRFDVGARFFALVGGHRRQLEIVGIALSPEWIYAIGPGDIVPDDRRFAVVWMSEKALAAAYDLGGGFSNVQLKLTRDAREAEVIERLDALLARWGGLGAYGRRDQTSHAFVDAELKQLEAMSRLLPPIFLVVAAFLVDMTLTRMIALERQEIGLLKALGYGDFQVGLHYVEFVAVIAVIGSAIGIVAGTRLGAGMAALYREFFHFPFLVFSLRPETWAISVGVTLVAALSGAIVAVRRVVRLAPAVAMQPPAPAHYGRHGSGRLWRLLGVRQTFVMVVRHLLHSPLRSLGSIFGIALAGAVLVGSMWVWGAADLMLDVTFHRADRQDATVAFTSARGAGALAALKALPGVIAVEPFRTLPAVLRRGTVERRVAITGRVPDADLSRVLGPGFVPAVLPTEGLALSDMLARILGARIGDLVEVELLERDRRRVELPVTAVIEGYLGLGAYMDIAAARRLMREGDTLSGAAIAWDPSASEAIFAALKRTPVVASVALQPMAMAKYRETLEQNLLVMVAVYVSLGMIIAFGVVYNFARISLSEQGREMASLRVLGLGRGEVSGILLAELAILTLAAQPLGWAIGRGIAAIMVRGLESELYRVPLVVGPPVYAWASLVVIAAAAVSGLLVRRRIDRLDLVEVLKTRE